MDTFYSVLKDNFHMTSTDNIEGKLLVHPHADLLCIVNRILIVNKSLARLFYCTSNARPTAYVIPPLLSFATTHRLIKFHEDHAKPTYNDPILPPHMSSCILTPPSTSLRQEESNKRSAQFHHSLTTRLINEYITGSPAI